MEISLTSCNLAEVDNPFIEGRCKWKIYFRLKKL